MKSHSRIWGGTRLAVIFLLLAIVAIPVGQVDAAASASPTTINIGIIYPHAPFPGLLPDWGNESDSFWAQAQADINGLPEAINQAVQFNLVVRWTDGTPAAASNAAQDLVNNEGIQAIVGLPTSPELSAAINFLVSNKIAVISPVSTGTAPQLMQADTVYRIMPNELYMARNLADIVMRQGYNKLAIIHYANGWGKDYTDELVNRLNASGCTTESVAITPLPPSPNNYAVAVRELADRVSSLGTGPRTAVIMVVGEGDDLIILNHARSFPTLHVPWFSALAGPELLTGMYAGLSLPDASDFADYVDLWSQESLLPQGGAADALLKNAESVLGYKPRAEHVYLYDAIQLMARAILLAGTYDGQDIADRIPQAAQHYGPATGPIHFDPNGDRDAGDLAYICTTASPGPYPYQYAYCAFFHGDAVTGSFVVPLPPEPRVVEWLR